MRALALSATLLVALGTVQAAESGRLNGFDLTGALIPRDQVMRGGPPRDGITALSDPRFMTAAQAELAPEDRVVGVRLGNVAKEWVLGVVVGGQPKAYPLRQCPEGGWRDVVVGKDIKVRCDAAQRSSSVFDLEGAELSSTQAYWFAWAAFHPKTALQGDTK